MRKSRSTRLPRFARSGIHLGYASQLARPRDVLDTLSAGEQAVVADAVEASGQHMDQETGG
jgi:hypothetical protein